MKYSSRFFLYAPLVLFLALAGWAMAHWWTVATAFDKKLTALNGHDAIPGITVSYTSKTISGFPFNIDVVFTGFAVKGAGVHGSFAWSTQRFALHRLTYGRAQDIYEAAGQQALSWHDSDGNAHHVDFLPAAMRASTIADGKGLGRFDLDITAASGKNEDGESFAIGRAQFHLRRDPARDGLDVMISADEAKTSQTHIRILRDYVTVIPGKAWAPLLAGTQSWADADAAWRKAGGTVLQGQRELAPAATGTRAIDAILASLY